MTRTKEDVETLCKKLLDGYLHHEAFEVNLDEFQMFYTEFIHLRKTYPTVSFVNLDNLVVAQFSDITPQHFDIIHTKPLTEENFSFVLNKNWYGAKKSQIGFLKFIWQEYCENWGKLLSIFLISMIILFSINNKAFYELISTFLIQSGTVFLSLYIIFTVSQSQTLYRDLSLFKSGILQKYYNDDKNVTLLGILTIALTFLSSGITQLLSNYLDGLPILWITLSSRVIKAFFTSFAITLLFDTFFTVATYYLERNRDVIERDLTADILDEDYKRHNDVNDQNFTD